MNQVVVTDDTDDAKLKYPYEITPVDPIIEKDLLRDFSGSNHNNFKTINKN